jgi:hypothetical protein
MEAFEDEAHEQEMLARVEKDGLRINQVQGNLMEYITANLKIEDFMRCLSEEMWLREVLKDVASNNSFVRSRALSMWGQHQGWLGKKNKKEANYDVEFKG